MQCFHVFPVQSTTPARQRWHPTCLCTRERSMEKPAPVSPPSGTVVVVAERPAARWSIRWALDAAVKFVWSNLAVPCLLQPFRDHLQHFAGRFLRRHARRLVGVADPYLTVTVAEHDGGEGTMRPRNDAYEEAKAYLGRRCCARGGGGARSLRAERARDDAGRRRFVLSLGDGEEVVDEFRGATVWWFHSAAPRRDHHHDGDVVAVEDDAAAATAGRTYRLTVFGGEVGAIAAAFPVPAVACDSCKPKRNRSDRSVFVAGELTEFYSVRWSKSSAARVLSSRTRIEQRSRASVPFLKMRAVLAQSNDLDEALESFGKEDQKKTPWTPEEKRKDPDVYEALQSREKMKGMVHNDGLSSSKGDALHRHRDLVVDSYLPHVCREGHAILSATRRRKLFTNTGERYTKSSWSHVVFKHPSTFETLAMDPRKKKEIMDDLDAFRNGEDYYKRIGKAWKRGYLLYGPPGTGKSSMIAAMANYLDYHIYDIELTSVSTNTDLRRMFIETTGKSIIAIEDIDCSLDLTGKRGTTTDATKKKKTKKKKSDGSGTTSSAVRNLTLSGVLNFIDGLWSACGGERIIVFTTNDVDKLDPALIRSGRMDKHIEMSYCCFESFKFLAKNYLDVDAHHLFDAVAALLKEVDITPADVAEILTPKQRAVAGEDADSCLAALVEALQKVKEESLEKKKKAKEEDAAQAKAKKAGGKKGKKEEEVEVADDDDDGDVRVLLREDDVAELLTSKCAGDDEGSCLDGPVEVLREGKETAMAAA
ncbi:hypothetical protein HU200_061443 [Digitaria exilis]|uniref:AAA+ ATPase domain-containing protein n=1 Tax=Digitaria exilis TaxID=1010633 RepID=A0A835A4T7_9POAL|nr:hypothetical protein HU200_061443 [Digitaria exilis]